MAFRYNLAPSVVPGLIFAKNGSSTYEVVMITGTLGGC